MSSKSIFLEYLSLPNLTWGKVVNLLRELNLKVIDSHLMLGRIHLPPLYLFLPAARRVYQWQRVPLLR